MRYSEEFRNKVVSRLLAKELSVREAAEQYDVSEFTLYEWKRKALAHGERSLFQNVTAR